MMTSVAKSARAKPGRARRTIAALAAKARSDAAIRKRTASALDEAREAGLLDDEATVHLSFRAPAKLVEAAKRSSGAERTTELGLLALSSLAQTDPTAAYMERTFGALGPDHTLEY